MKTETPNGTFPSPACDLTYQWSAQTVYAKILIAANSGICRSLQFVPNITRCSSTAVRIAGSRSRGIERALAYVIADMIGVRLDQPNCRRRNAKPCSY